MPPALGAIITAQFQILRNHLPRAGFASVLGHLLSLAWYALAATIAFGLAVLIPSVPFSGLQRWLAPALLGIFAYWQVVPLFTLSTGWSLQLSKLQMYPISNGQLFMIELILRVTSSPEMIVILLGGTVGLMRHPSLPLFAPLALLLFIPLNLFLSLAVREVLLHSFERNRLREIFAIVLFSLSVLPQVLLKAGFAEQLRPYLEAGSQGRLTPWHAEASLSLGQPHILEFTVLLFWTALTFVLAHRMFMRSLRFEENCRAGRARSCYQPNKRGKGGARLVLAFISAVQRPVSDFDRKGVSIARPYPSIPHTFWNGLHLQRADLRSAGRQHDARWKHLSRPQLLSGHYVVWPSASKRCRDPECLRH